MDDGRLTEIAGRAGERYGFTEARAAFAPFRDMKVRWVRCSGEISFELSDYLADAPEDAVEGLFDTVFRRIRGEDADYPPAFVEWVTSDRFRWRNQGTYVSRSRHIDAEKDGSALRESYQRLVDKGLVKEIEGLRLYWSDIDAAAKTGESSCLMRVVSMTPALLDAGTEVLDYCLLYHLSNIQEGFGSDDADRTEKITMILDRYMGKDDARKWLEEKGVEL